jgi:uncharacterized phiE125 gp8 family phage protein
MAEPLTTAELKAHIRKTTTDEDALIASYGIAAREWCEDYTSHVLVEREITTSFTAFGDYLTIYSTPNVVIDSIAYVDANGDVADFAYFAFPSGTYPVKVYPDSAWPTIDDNSAILVTYTAGYADAANVPEKFKWAIKLLVASMYENRGSIDPETMEAVRFILRSYRGTVMA